MALQMGVVGVLGGSTARGQWEKVYSMCIVLLLIKTRVEQGVVTSLESVVITISCRHCYRELFVGEN